ncbi:MAG: tyrosine-protein phosphatase [Gemmataceae bacterium]
MFARLALTRRTGLRLLVTVLFAGLGVEVFRTYLGRNWHELLPGRAYRCAQLRPAQMQDAIKRYGIKTVINLRGCSQYLDWYIEESRATHDLGISQEDITMSAIRLPAPAEVRRLVEVIDQTDYPVLIHCRQGIDRTGLASAIVLLLQTDVPLAEARGQLGLRYGHIPLGPTRHMGMFFDLYEGWLARHGQAHSRETFRKWVDDGYCPAQCRGQLELLDLPARAPLGEPFAVTIRATNTSDLPWQFQPGTYTGVCLKALVFDPDIKLVQVRHAGQYRATIPPGESVLLNLAIGPLQRPGRYVLSADMVAPGGWAFAQHGSEPIQVEFIVGESPAGPTGGIGGNQ